MASRPFSVLSNAMNPTFPAERPGITIVEYTSPLARFESSTSSRKTFLGAVSHVENTCKFRNSGSHARGICWHWTHSSDILSRVRTSSRICNSLYIGISIGD
jgi:hypothetical protein